MPQSLPMILEPQVVPSEVCCRCEVCCRFPEAGSLLRPYFTDVEIGQAISHGIDSAYFTNRSGCQISVISDHTGDGYLCPAFDPETRHCRIYPVRPLDCQLYPFALMWSDAEDYVLFGWDPKCPFLLVQSGEDLPPFLSDKDPSRLTLPDSLVQQAHSVAGMLESKKTLEYLSTHPRLITAFQPDVVIIKRLNRLTAALLPPQ
ncbi:MAG: YkgJ family cysteine cluster protein [Nitrospirales bacterium]